jgi:transcriptional regulator with XRE-family HTH domain
MTVSEGPADLARSVGHKLRTLREQHDLVQTDLAARLQAAGMERGASAKTVSAWERGETPLPLVALTPLAQAFRMERGALARRLGLCGEIDRREIVLAGGADALNQLAEEPPEVSDTILRWLRESVQIARTARLARTN